MNNYTKLKELHEYLIENDIRTIFSPGIGLEKIEVVYDYHHVPMIVVGGEENQLYPAVFRCPLDTDFSKIKVNTNDRIYKKCVDNKWYFIVFEPEGCRLSSMFDSGVNEAALRVAFTIQTDEFSISRYLENITQPVILTVHMGYYSILTLAQEYTDFALTILDSNYIEDVEVGCIRFEVCSNLDLFDDLATSNGLCPTSETETSFIEFMYNDDKDKLDKIKATLDLWVMAGYDGFIDVHINPQYQDRIDFVQKLTYYLMD